LFGRKLTFTKPFNILLGFHHRCISMTTKIGDLILPTILTIAGIIITILTMLLDKGGAWLGVGLLLIIVGTSIHFLTRE